MKATKHLKALYKGLSDYNKMKLKQANCKGGRNACVGNRRDIHGVVLEKSNTN